MKQRFDIDLALLMKKGFNIDPIATHDPKPAMHMQERDMKNAPLFEHESS